VEVGNNIFIEGLHILTELDEAWSLPALNPQCCIEGELILLCVSGPSLLPPDVFHPT
jgi:hypothetical protein